MSDNIDYAELDKAVNEAIQNRSVAKKASVSSKPVTRPASVMHRPHGQFMDFAPVHSGHHLARPTSVASKPIMRPAAAPAVAHPVARPTVARPALRPATPKITTAPQPAIVPRSAKIGTAAKPVRPSVSAQIQQKQQAVAIKPVAKPVEKPVEKTAPKPAAPKAEEKPVTKPVVEKKAPKAEKAPNANNYSLGVRSPFMTNTKVEKRPLGKDIPETSTATLRSTKNIYSSKSPSKASSVKKKHMVTEAPKKRSGWLWTLVVLLVIAAGAGLGYLAYILVFAK